MLGYREERSTTTPFDICELNNPDRFQFASEATRGVPLLGKQVGAVQKSYSEQIQHRRLYVPENGEDLREIRNWRWPSERS